MNVQPMRVLPRPQPRPISDWEDAEENAVEWVRWLGFARARRTPSGADGGLDIDGHGVFGQVKFHGRAIAPNLIQQLFGARGRREGEMFFFSNSGYTKAALDCADDLEVGCFQYSPTDGNISPCNTYARKLMQAEQSSVQARENESSRSIKVLSKPDSIDGGCVDFSPDGSLIAYKSSDRSASVVEFSSRKKIATFEAECDVMGVEFIDSASLAIHLPFRNKTIIWNWRDNVVLRTMEEPYEGGARYVRKVHCGGQVLLTNNGDGFGADRLDVWSTRTGELEESFQFSGASSASGSLVSWGMSPKRVLATCVCKTSGKKRSWHLRIADKSHQISPGDRDGVVHHFAFTSDGSLMAAIGETPRIDLWDLGQIKQAGALRTSNPLMEEEEDSLTAVVFSADNSILAVAGYDKTVRLWSVSLREEIAMLEGCEEDIDKLSFSPNGQYLAASGDGGVTRFWDLMELH